MIHLNFLEYSFLGNTIESYLWFFGILTIGIILKNFISRIFSKLLYSIFKRYGKTVGVDSFLQLMNRPFSFLSW